MSTAITPIKEIKGEPLTPEQQEYLDGFFAGLAARGLKFSDLEAAPTAPKPVSLDDLIFEERVKRELHPLDAYPQLLENRSEERRVGKGVDLGGRRIIKKKKKR